MLFVILILIYAWLLYPILALMCAHLRRSPEKLAPAKPATFAIVFAAHNEEAVIAGRLQNLAETCGPIPGFQGVLLGLDGCVDATAARAAAAVAAVRAAHPELAGLMRIIDFPERRGKVAVLKDLVGMTDAEVLIGTDANTWFEPDAVARLLAPLADQAVGAVVGRLVLEEEEDEGG